jgi:hypothetical protein
MQKYSLKQEVCDPHCRSHFHALAYRLVLWTGVGKNHLKRESYHQTLQLGDQRHLHFYSSNPYGLSSSLAK